MTLPKYFLHILQCKTLCLKQNHIVKEQVAAFIQKQRIVGILCFNNHFHGLLAYFLCHGIDALSEKGCYI